MIFLTFTCIAAYGLTGVYLAGRWDVEWNLRERYTTDDACRLVLAGTFWPLVLSCKGLGKLFELGFAKRTQEIETAEKRKALQEELERETQKALKELNDEI